MQYIVTDCTDVHYNMVEFSEVRCTALHCDVG